MNDTQRRIEQALSLRDPQKESLDILAKILEKINLSKDASVEETLRIIQEFRPSVKDFERIFPCICFAIATGVGKTRLMGAMIAYLHQEYNIRNFMVLAPNLTIYNKLKTDFTPNTPKYVFPGLREYVGDPQIITGDDYNQVGGLFDNPNDDRVRINIFNISKIDSDKDARGTPRVRRMAEYLGQSYFDYLSGLKDLVLIMDEAHRYRANAGMAAINELRPVFGIELTATAKSTGSKGKPFRNIAYEYNLAHAIRDGYVKKPAVVGRSDFDISVYGSEESPELETLKILDAIKVHESLKAELQVYADNKNKKTVKPFIMIVAKNIEHADELKARIDSDDFQEGRYKGKVIVVNSKQNGELKDEVLQRLLAIESADEPTEIVIHVNMLGEGWDVNNLYTIVPLRKADSKILVEQSIGRGLRLPFGELTGNEHIDRLHVIAHDNFQKIIETARNNKFEFQQEYIDNSTDGLVGKQVIENTSLLDKEISNIIVKKPVSPTEQKTLPVFSNEVNKQISNSVRESINELSRYVVSSKDLSTPENQEKLVEQVKMKLQNIKLDNSELSSEPLVDIKETVRCYTQKFQTLNLDIPRIKIGYEQEGSFILNDFDIDTADFQRYEPLPQKMLITEILGKNKQEEMMAEFVDRYENITHYLLTPLTINFISSYSGSEQNTRKILFFHGKKIAKKLYEQIKLHIQDAPVKMKVRVDSGYTAVTSASYKIIKAENLPACDYRSAIHDKSKIRNMIFEGFNKCLFEKQKFDSCTEKDLSEILERSAIVLKWFKISNDRANDIFSLKYYNSKTGESCSYLPDFIVETTNGKYIIETKAENQLDDKTAQAKKKIAIQWCQYATDFELQHGGKEWNYLLIPDTTVVIGRSFEALISGYKEK